MFFYTTAFTFTRKLLTILGTSRSQHIFWNFPLTEVCSQQDFSCLDSLLVENLRWGGVRVRSARGEGVSCSSDCFWVKTQQVRGQGKTFPTADMAYLTFCRLFLDSFPWTVKYKTGFVVLSVHFWCFIAFLRSPLYQRTPGNFWSDSGHSDPDIF